MSCRSWILVDKERAGQGEGGMEERVLSCVFARNIPGKGGRAG